MGFGIHVYHHADCEQIRILNEILNQNIKIMASIKELSDQVDRLQSALDTEQDQIAGVISKLQQTVSDLQGMAADGGTVEERQALSDKLEAVILDLQGTIPDEQEQEPE